MRRLIFLTASVFNLLLLVEFTSYGQPNDAESPVDLVNPYIGTISHLLVPTFVTVHLPNSMLRVIPERRSFTTDRMNGLPVVTTSHRGSSAFNLSPIHGNGEDMQPIYAYSYDQEAVKPYSYDVYLDEENVDVSFAVSHQAGVYYYTYERENEDKYLLVNNRNGKISIDKNAVSGYQIVSGNGTKV